MSFLGSVYGWLMSMAGVVMFGGWAISASRRLRQGRWNIPPFFKRHPFLGTLLGYPDRGWHRHLRLDPTYDTALARMQLAIAALMLVAAAAYVVVKATSWLMAA